MIKKIILISVVVCGFAFFINKNLPRGIRNKNPMNIKYDSANEWEGQNGSDGTFSVFTQHKYGIRAGAKLLHNYMTVHGLRSVLAIVDRWAPSSENDVSAYASFIAKRLNVSVSDAIGIDKIRPMVKAMIEFECGVMPYSSDVLNDGFEMAGV